MRELYEYHRSWVLLLSSMVLILTVTPYLTGSMTDAHNNKKASLTNERDLLSKKVTQWKEDNKKAIEISQTFSKTEIDNLLTTADRDTMTAQLESLAALAKLSNMRYILSPLKPWDGGKHFPGIQNIFTSTLLVEANAPHGGSIFNFMNKLDSVEGKMALKKLEITPLRKDTAKKLRAYNLHFKATYQWLANGAEK